MSGSERFKYLPWYVRDFWDDPQVRMLRWIDRAFYQDMLKASWEAGPLPDCEVSILRLIGWDGLELGHISFEADEVYNKFDASEIVRELLGQFFIQGPDGCWTNRRLEKERDHARSVVEANRLRTEAATKARQRDDQRNGQRHVQRNEVQEQDQEQESLPPTVATQPTGALAPPAPGVNGHEPKKARKPPTGPAADLVKAFAEEDWPFYRRDVGPYVPQGRDFIAAARLLKVHPVKEIRRRAQNMLMRETDFWRENASLHFLEARWNGLALEPGGE